MKGRSFALTVALVGWVHVAAAQVPSASDRETARTLMDEGDQAFADKRFADALRAYREADGIMHVPTTALEVAKAHEALGQLLEAKEACRRAVAYPKQAAEPKPFTSARETCTTLSQSLGTRIPSVTIHLVGLSPGTTPVMTIDGESVTVPSSEVKRRVNPGAHKVQIKAPGYEDVTTSFTVAERGSEQIEITLRAGASGPQATAQPESTAATAKGGMPLYAKIAFGAGGAGLVFGTVTGVMALSSASSAKEKCINNVCDPAASSDIDSTKSLSHLSTAGFAVAVFGIGVGVVGLLTRDSAPAAAKVEAYFNGTGGGVAGRF